MKDWNEQRALCTPQYSHCSSGPTTNFDHLLQRKEWLKHFVLGLLIRITDHTSTQVCDHQVPSTHIIVMKQKLIHTIHTVVRGIKNNNKYAVICKKYRKSRVQSFEIQEYTWARTHARTHTLQGITAVLTAVCGRSSTLTVSLFSSLCPSLFLSLFSLSH